MTRTFYPKGPHIVRALRAATAWDDVTRFLAYGAGQGREIRCCLPSADYEEAEGERTSHEAGFGASTRRDMVSTFGLFFLSAKDDKAEPAE